MNIKHTRTGRIPMKKKSAKGVTKKEEGGSPQLNSQLDIKQMFAEKLSDRCRTFEKKEGFAELIAMGVSALNRLLIAKGLVSEEELQKAMWNELELAEQHSDGDPDGGTLNDEK